MSHYILVIFHFYFPLFIYHDSIIATVDRKVKYPPKIDSRVENIISLDKHCINIYNINDKFKIISSKKGKL